MKTKQSPGIALLDGLRSRFIARACVCSEAIQKAILNMRYHDAHESMIRRDIFLAAADMTEQEMEQLSVAETREATGGLALGK